MGRANFLEISIGVARRDFVGSSHTAYAVEAFIDEVAAAAGQDPYRFMMYYLPEYRVLQLDPQAHSILAARGRQQGSWQPATDCQLQATDAVWVLLSRSEPGLIPDATVLTPDATPFQVWHTRPTADTRDYAGFAISAVPPIASSC